MGMDHYRIIKQLGGTSGTYLAVDKQNEEKKVVIKRLMDGTQGMQELNVSLRVRHPNIITFLESFVHDGALYVVLAYAEGGDLEVYLEHLAREKKPLPLPLMLKWFKQLIEALQCCHAQDIMHRDVKPGNVFLNAERTELYLGDFGSAKTLLRSASMTSTFVGTPIWISPELLTGTPYSYPSDIWSLGCIFYEMAALKRPFSPSSFADLVHQITSGDFTPLPAGVPEDVRNIIMSMLQVDASKRCSLTKALEMTERAIAARTPIIIPKNGDRLCLEKSPPPPHLPKRVMDAAMKVQQQRLSESLGGSEKADEEVRENRVKDYTEDTEKLSEWILARTHDVNIIECYLENFRQSDEQVLAATASTVEEIQREREKNIEVVSSPTRVSTPPPLNQRNESRPRQNIVWEVRVDAPQQQIQQQNPRPVVYAKRRFQCIKSNPRKNEQNEVNVNNRDASPLARMPSSSHHMNGGGHASQAFKRLKSTPSVIRHASPQLDEERQLQREKREQERAKMLEMIREQKAKAMQERKARGKSERKDALAVEIVLPDNVRYVDHNA